MQVVEDKTIYTILNRAREIDPDVKLNNDYWTRNWVSITLSSDGENYHAEVLSVHSLKLIVQKSGRFGRVQVESLYYVEVPECNCNYGE
ncbi:MAG: hypothetical protein F7B59_04880 [Desulfurococcales archaeon]|nr:hypothetical protein [Desulfurococcales archaeon]